MSWPSFIKFDTSFGKRIAFIKVSATTDLHYQTIRYLEPLVYKAQSLFFFFIRVNNYKKHRIKKMKRLVSTPLTNATWTISTKGYQLVSKGRGVLLAEDERTTTTPWAGSTALSGPARQS